MNDEPWRRAYVIFELVWTHILSRITPDPIPFTGTLVVMAEGPIPVSRMMEEVLLGGTMAIYESQAELSEGIPRQWREFRSGHPELCEDSELYGASPCTDDRKIHYLTGVAQKGRAGFVIGECLTLEAGEYAVARVENAALLRATWIWLLGSWLPTSGRRERSAPEFERYTGISDLGYPIGSVEIWIPLEPLETH